MADVYVNLKKDWFGPGATLFLARDNPHTFSAEWAEEPSKEQKEKSPTQRYTVLPSSAEVVEGPEEAPKKPVKKPAASEE